MVSSQLQFSINSGIIGFSLIDTDGHSQGKMPCKDVGQMARYCCVQTARNRLWRDLAYAIGALLAGLLAGNSYSWITTNED
jgi:hypothetical protein